MSESYLAESPPWEIAHESYGPDPSGPYAGDSTAVRLPPQNVQAEMACLGSCMLENSALDDVLGILQPEHFYADCNQMVFAVLRDKRNAGLSQIDALTVAEELANRNQLVKIGGPEYLHNVMETVPHAAHAVSYANMVLDAARRRGAEFAANQILRDTPRKDIPTDDLLSDAESAIHAVMEDGTPDQPVSLSEVMATAIHGIENGQPSTIRIPSLWPHLDSVIGGFPVGGLSILAARPSVGKTACILSIALNKAQAGTPVQFHTLEQSRLEVAERLLSNYSGIPHRKLAQNGYLTQEERHHALHAAGEMQALPMFIDDKYLTMTQLATAVRLGARRHGVKLVIVDYLSLITPDRRNNSREQEVAGISRGLKMLARSCDVALVVLHQLNRDIEKRENKRPRLSDLRESGAIEQDADLVMFLYRPNQDNSNDQGEWADDDHAILIVAKQRNGPLADVRLAWLKERMKYEDVTPDFNGPAPVFSSDSQGELF